MSCQTCGSYKTLEDFLASLFKKHTATGTIGIYLNTIQLTNCNELEDAVSCGQTMSLEDLIKNSCNLDSCDNPTINIFLAPRE